MFSPGETKAKKTQLILKKVECGVLKWMRGGFRGPDLSHEMISITVGDPSFKAKKNQGAGQGSAQEKLRHMSVCFAAVLP